MPHSWTEVAADLQSKLARYSGPAFRLAYWNHLLASGSKLSAAGDLRTGSYCFDKITTALKDLNLGEPFADSIAGDGAKTSPLEIMRHQWRKDRLLNTEAVLRRQGKRLSTLEIQLYVDKLEKLRAAGDKASTRFQFSKVDASLLDLRRKLYKRVLKSQKTTLRPARSSAAMLRKALLLPSEAPHQSKQAALPNAQNKADMAPLAAIIGPYNDRYNLGDFLTLLAQADAAWVEEFLDLYKDLRDLKGLVSTGF
jgi:hypothetical protein